MSTIPVVIMAGGLGTRLNNNPEIYPKVLTTVCGKPFLYWKIKQLLDQDIDEFYLLLGKGAQLVIDYVNELNLPNARFYFFHDGQYLLGTGGSLVKALPKLPRHFLLTFGDNLLDLPIKNFLPKAIVSKSNLIVGTTFTGKADKKNLLVKNGFVLTYFKNGSEIATHTDYGYVFLQSESLKSFNQIFNFGLEIILELLISQRKLFCHTTDSRYYEIGTPETLKETERYVKNFNLNL